MDYNGEQKHIDLSAFRANETEDVRFSRDIVLPSYLGVCQNGAKVSFSGTITFNDEVFTLSGSGNISYEIPCARCLKPTKESYDFQLEEKFSRTLDTTGEKTLIVDNKIDVIDAVTLCLISEIPRKSVCNEDCEGLYHLIKEEVSLMRDFE